MLITIPFHRSYSYNVFGCRLIISGTLMESNFISHSLSFTKTVADKDVEAETRDIKEVLAILQRMESKFDKRMDAIECDIAVIKKAITKKKSKKV